MGSLLHLFFSLFCVFVDWGDVEEWAALQLETIQLLGVHDVLKMEFLDVRRKAVNKRLFQILVALEIPFFEMVVMLDVLSWDCEMWVFVMLFPFEICGLMGVNKIGTFDMSRAAWMFSISSFLAHRNSRSEGQLEDL